MKKNCCLLLTAAMIFSCCISTFAAEGIIYGKRTYVAVRGVFDALGFTVEWDNDTQTAKMYDADHTISVCRWDYYMLVDGHIETGEAVHRIIDGKMYLPLRELVEDIDAEVSWDAETKTAHVTYQGKEVYIDCDHTFPTPQSSPVQFNKGKYYPASNIPDMGAFFGIAEGHYYSYKTATQTVYTYSAGSLKGGDINPYCTYLRELGFEENTAAENYMNGPGLRAYVFEKDGWYVMIEYDGGSYFVKYAPGVIVLPGEERG